jgi:hypothetical protein
LPPAGQCRLRDIQPLGGLGCTNKAFHVAT